MAGRGRAPLKETPRRRARPLPTPRERAPLVYTAQDVARFCEVDLKTIHHWANAGKIAHHRTEGRHLRFRRNHLVAFLRTHGYPLHDAITSQRPTVFVAAPVGHELGSDELTKKLSSRFFVVRFEHAITAIAQLSLKEPDALVVTLEDPSLNGTASLAALKAEPETSWPAIVVIAEGVDVAGADLVLSKDSLSRLHTELANTLGVD